MKKVYEAVINLMSITAGLLLLFLVLAISYGVFMRYVFSSPVAWITEISSYILLFITFLGAPKLLMHDQHVKVDLVINNLDRKKERVLKVITSALGATVSFLIFWYGMELTIDYWRRDIQMMNVLTIPKYYLISVIPFGSFFLTIEFARKIYLGVMSANDVAKEG